MWLTTTSTDDKGGGSDESRMLTILKTGIVLAPARNFNCCRRGLKLTRESLK